MQDGGFGRCMAHRDALEEAHDLVGGIADQAAGQWHARDLRQRPRRQRERPAQQAQQRLPALRHGVLLGADGQALAGQADLQALAKADEGIARQPLPALDTFEEEARIEGRQLREGRNRRVQVACDVEWRLQNVHLEDNKKPIPVCAGDGFWFGILCLLILSDNAQHPLRQERGHHQRREVSLAFIGQSMARPASPSQGRKLPPYPTRSHGAHTGRYPS